MKELILGNGFIGSRMHEELGYDGCMNMIDCFEDVQNILDAYKPEVIINCIMYSPTKNVDDCEAHKDAALFANTTIPIMLADVCHQRGIRLVQLSSGCLYQDLGYPRREDEDADFFGLYYSRTKIYMEQALKVYPDILIPRLRIPLDNRPHPRNILTKLLKFDKVIDVPNSVTYLPDFFRALRHLIDIKASGIYNIVNKGVLRYPRLLDMYGAPYTIIPRGELGLVRTDLTLSVEKLEQTGFSMPYIHDRLAECVKEYEDGC